MFKRNTKIRLVLTVTLIASHFIALGNNEDFNPILTAVPIMGVAPDARSSGMGDMGVATAPDASSQAWNAAKYPFMTPRMGISLSYVPWLRQLVNDVNIAYLNYYYRVDEVQTVSAALRYFSLGNMIITDEQGREITNVSPNEFSIDVAYSRKFGEHVGGALAMRYIRSDLTGGYADFGSGNVGGIEPANAFGADMSFYYQNEHGDNEYSIGAAISNMGNKVSYTQNADKYFLPTTLRVGGRYTYNIDPDNSITGGIELSKLLVPSPPIRDSVNGQYVIAKGMDNNVGTVQGMFQSFYDAPYGFKEEISEIMLGIGAEYWYRKLFAARAGYFYDSPRKGDRSYLTFGAGIKYSFLSLDFSYLYSFTLTNPLSNTLRITLTIDINTGRNVSGRNTR